jgi:hypothetical protein
MHALAIFERNPNGRLANWSFEPIARNQATMTQAQAFDPCFRPQTNSAEILLHSIQNQGDGFLFALILLPRTLRDDLDAEVKGFPNIAPSAPYIRNESQTTKLAFFAVTLVPHLDGLDAEVEGFPNIAPSATKSRKESHTTKLAGDGRLAFELELATAGGPADPFLHNAGLIPNHETRNRHDGVHPRAEASGRVPHRRLGDVWQQPTWQNTPTKSILLFTLYVLQCGLTKIYQSQPSPGK